MYKKNHIIYLAGILDGEGWFSIQRVRREGSRSTSYSPTIGVANTNKALIDWLLNNFDGNFQERKPHPNQYGRKLRYEWKLNWTKSKELLPKIIPFLICKKEQAKILIEIGKLNSVKYRHCGVPKHISEKKETLYLMLRKLNNTHHKILSLLNLVKE